MAVPAYAEIQTAVFAGGCFWCLEADFEKLPGVISADSGYAGSNIGTPTYEQVSAGRTAYAESVRVSYDNTKIKYTELLSYFWKHIDPTVKDKQFCDSGHQYRTAIFYANDEQKIMAEQSKQALISSGKFPQIYTEVAPVGKFTLAEDYHQDYYKKNPIRYKFYRAQCGRDARIKEVWGLPAENLPTVNK